MATPYDIGWKEIPVYICNRNNLDRGFRRQVEWLLSTGMRHIVVLDNQSSYPPLLAYYNAMQGKIDVQVQKANQGPWVFWDTKLHETVETPYVVSDADVVPAAGCPKDLIEKLLFVLRNHPKIVQKVGPGLRIDNLPDHYAKKQQVIAHETQFSLEAHRESFGASPWVVQGTPEMFDALIDTTFALYHPKSYFPGWHHHYRLDKPYVIEHLPWYEDSSAVSAEHEFYKAHAENGWATWEER